MKRSTFKRPEYVRPEPAPLRPIPIELRKRVSMPRCDGMGTDTGKRGMSIGEHSPSDLPLAGNCGGERGMSFPKSKPWRSEAWRRAVASLPCAECGKHGPSQAAHINHLGKGMSTKPSDAYTVPLCPDCHREYDQGKSYTKAERHDAATGWLVATINELAKMGLIKPV